MCQHSLPFFLKQLTRHIARSISRSPDDHVAVGTHGCSGPSRNMFGHLDQGVLIFGVGLRHRSGWDGTPRDVSTAVALHPERWGDQTNLWTVAYIESERGIKSCMTKGEMMNRKKRIGLLKDLFFFF